VRAGPPSQGKQQGQPPKRGPALTGAALAAEKASKIKAKALKRKRSGLGDDGDGPPAKRKGQRERRRLYEKMYGREAKHIVSGAGHVDTREYNASAKKAARKPAPSAGSRPAAPAAVPSAGGTEPVHPSWAAKQQQQASLAAAPAGKKVVFGDNGAALVIGSGTGARKGPGAPGSTEVLHPSWEAKRKLKEQSAAMAAAMARPQGKKLTFDSD
jgi:hypothetical protein